ncbi:MAG: hypothetical protein AAF327_23225 [Cyanobacteria bacterium P01_A01_bin.37]
MVFGAAVWVCGAVVGGGRLFSFGAVGVVGACFVCGVGSGGGARWVCAAAGRSARWPGALSVGALAGWGLRLPFFALEDGDRPNTNSKPKFVLIVR